MEFYLESQTIKRESVMNRKKLSAIHWQKAIRSGLPISRKTTANGTTWMCGCAVVVFSTEDNLGHAQEMLSKASESKEKA